MAQEAPYEFYKDPEILREIGDQKAEKPRYSPVAIAALKGKEIDLCAKERVIIDPIVSRSQPSQKPKRTNHNNAVMSTPKKPTKPKAEKTPPATIHPQHGLGSIQSTNQYHPFKLLDVNRKVDKRHVNNLVKRIKEKNLLHLRPITVDADMNVIDGQHRLEAAQILKVPIYYTKDDKVLEEDIAGLNTHQKNWGVEDYLHFYANKGAQEFKTFLAFAAEYPHLKSSLLLPLVSGTGKRKAPALKSGILDISNIEKARVLLQQLEDLKAYSDLVTGTRFVEAFTTVAMHPEYDHKRMLAKIAADPTAIVPCPNQKGFMIMLQALYNKGVHEKNIVMFIKRL